MDLLLVAGFSVALGLPLLDSAFGLDPVPRQAAGARRSVSWPGLDAAWQRAGSQPLELAADLRKLAGEAFGFRNSLIQLYARISVLGLGVSSTDKILLGREGWAYLRTDRALDSYRATTPYSKQELDHLLAVAEARRRWFEERGMSYLWVVAPNKHTVHPEYLPRELRRVRDETRLDQLVAAFEERSQLRLLDLREVLLPAAKELRLYDPLGTHWNDVGAFLAYRAIIELLREDRPEIEALALGDFSQREAPSRDNAIAPMLGLGGILETASVHFEPRFRLRALDMQSGQALEEVERIGLRPEFGSRRASSLGPRLLVLRDSFGSALVPFLSETLPEVVYLWPHSMQISGSDQQRIQRAESEVVVQLFVERALERPPLELEVFGAAPVGKF